MPTLHYQGHQINYYQYGHGTKLMVGLHGFADKGNLFENLSTILAKDYTTIALDLPFHGETNWEGDLYQPEDMKAIITLLMQQQQVTEVALMCHSMGARVVWAVLPLMTETIEQLYFFAPAGFQYTFTASRFWFPLWLRTRFRAHFERSDGIVRFFDIIHRFGFMNRATYLVFRQQLDLPRRRARLLQTWMSMYYFPMGPQKHAADLLNKHQIPTYFFYGKKDRVTPARYASKFTQQLQLTNILIVEGNHFFMRDKVIEPFVAWYNDN